MSSPALLTLSQKLTTTSSLLLERSRVLSLNLPPSASSQNQIVRNLTVIKNELDKLEDAQDSNIKGGSQAKGGAKGKDGQQQQQQQIEELAQQYDRLLDMFAEDEVGREKGKALRREKRQPTPDPSAEITPNATPSPPEATNPFADHATGSAGKPRQSRTASSMPYRDDDSDEEEVVGFTATAPSVSGSAARSGLGLPTQSKGTHDYDPDSDGAEGGESDGQMLTSQRMLMEDQDERLNVLSQSIGRQNHLSIQIGTELDEQHELLEDVDGAMDRTADRLGRARRRLDHFAHDAKQHGSLLTIVGLIVILLLLIIVFKT